MFQQQTVELQKIQGIWIDTQWLQQAGLGENIRVIIGPGEIRLMKTPMMAATSLPKASESDSIQIQSPLHSLIGIAETKDPTASKRVKEILATELDSQAGWTYTE